MVRQLAREYATNFLNNIRNPHIQATIAENFAHDSEMMAGPTNSIEQNLNGGTNAKPRAEPGTTIPTGSTSRTSARSGTATIQRLEKQQNRVKNPQNPFDRVAWLEQAATTKRGRSESDDEDDVEEEHREKRRHIDDTSFSPEKVAHRRSVQSTEKENDAAFTGGSTPGNSPKKSAKKAPAPKPSSGKRKAIPVDDSESDDGEATAPSAKKTAKDGEYVPSDTEEDVLTPKPKPTKTKKKTVRPADAEENEEPVAPVAKKRTARKTVPPGDAEKETVKAPAVRPRKKTKRTVDSEDDEDAAGAPDHQGKESSKASTRVPRKNKNAMLEDPAMTDDSFFVTLRSAMKLEGPMPPGSLQFIELYMTAYGLYITAQKLLQEERRLVLDADINKLNQEYQRQCLALREREVALRERELDLREREHVLRANEIQGGGN